MAELASKASGGREITAEDLQMATAGYTATQRRAIAQRAEIVNSCVCVEEDSTAQCTPSRLLALIGVIPLYPLL